jgi:hypothetical protein
MHSGRVRHVDLRGVSLDSGHPLGIQRNVGNVLFVNK